MRSLSIIADKILSIGWFVYSAVETITNAMGIFLFNSIRYYFHEKWKGECFPFILIF